jgi:hypothetical protein
MCLRNLLRTEFAKGGRRKQARFSLVLEISRASKACFCRYECSKHTPAKQEIGAVVPQFTGQSATPGQLPI